MASLSSLLNPSSSSKSPPDTKVKLEPNVRDDMLNNSTISQQQQQQQQQDSEPAPHKFHPPTSVSELLMYQSAQEEANNNNNNNNHHHHNSNNNSSSGNSSSKGNLITQPQSASSTDQSLSRAEPIKAYQTLLINARSRHLKKNDGEPYWRNEVQFEFLLRLLFNHDRVFKNPYFNTIHGFDWPDHFHYYKDENGNLHQSRGEILTFFELYLITLLKSSKISKILKARLMLDINYALNFAVICLLVNIGRLNTTVNFDYEMKSQFRTYHSIPSLQVGNHFTIIEKYYQIHETPEDEPNSPQPNLYDPTSKQNNATLGDKSSVASTSINQSVRNGSGYTMSTVKQLQDTPRIKSILKSVNDLTGKIPKSYKEFIEEISKPDHNVNIVSLVFLICSHEYDIGQSFFPYDFDGSIPPRFASTGSLLNDIWLRPKFKSTDKVKKFLWLIYTLLETKLSIPEMMANPFNVISTTPTALNIDPLIKLSDEVSIIDHKNPSISPTITLMQSIIPKWSIPTPTDVIDPLLNDFDTAQEVEFAAQMKQLRAQFVEQESLHSNINSNHTNNTVVLPLNEDNPNNQSKLQSQVIQSDSLGRSIQVKQFNQELLQQEHVSISNYQHQRAPKKLVNYNLESDSFSPRFYNPVRNRNFSRQKIMESATSSYDSGMADDMSYSFDNNGSKENQNNHTLDEYDDGIDNDMHDDVGDGNDNDNYGLVSNHDNNDHYREKAISHEQNVGDSTTEEVTPNGDDTDDEELSCSEYKDETFPEIISKDVDNYSATSVIRSLKRPNDDSIELSAMDPLNMSSYEDNYEDGGLIGFFNYGYPGPVVNEFRKSDDGSMLLTSCVKKRKTRKQMIIEPSIKNTIKELEIYLNRDNKSVHSNSKNAILKREKYRMIAEFLFEIMKDKQSQAKALRLKEGNWAHFTKHMWDLNMFIEKEQKRLRSDFADWGEFKTSMIKMLNKVNIVIGTRININKYMKESTGFSEKGVEDEQQTSFIDDAFSQL